jgi:hypothetical protein
VSIWLGSKRAIEASTWRRKLAAVVKMHLLEKRKANSLDGFNAARFDLQNCEHSCQGS